MHTALFTHPSCLDHEMGPHHPERPARLKAILGLLERETFQHLDRREAPRATEDQIARVHSPGYVDDVLSGGPQSGYRHLDPDTAMCPDTAEAARRAAGALCAAVDEVLSGRSRNAFCAVRPPGHHAERDRAMGFCFFNNVAIGAAHARAVHGLDRVAIVDFDVHHGNGSQHMFADEGAVMYCSSHQSPCYPGTGAQSEHGVAGNIVNVELAPGSGSAEFRRGYEDRILPALRAFAPQLLFISAGFDGHARDPLAYLRLATEDFAWVTAELLKVAEETCEGRVVSTLEGGYDLEALAAAAGVHLAVLMGHHD